MKKKYTISANAVLSDDTVVSSLEVWRDIGSTEEFDNNHLVDTIIILQPHVITTEMFFFDAERLKKIKTIVKYVQIFF